MDGGTGSELQRRGANVLVATTAESELKAWSATANVDFAEVVQQVHQDYLRVGADLIISNNFWTTPRRLAMVDLADSWEHYARAAGQNALRARDALNPEAYVFGGIAPPYVYDHRVAAPTSDVQALGAAAVREEFRQPARVLAELGVDAILAEYVGFIEDCVVAVEGCTSVGLPVFVGVRHLTEDGRMQYGETLEELASALRGHRIDGILLMCSRPECVSAGLPLLRQAFEGAIGAYANVGYNPMAPVGGRPHRGHDLQEPGPYSPSSLAAFAQEWKEIGAQMVGGCCGTGPEHIMMMKSTIKAQ